MNESSGPNLKALAECQYHVFRQPPLPTTPGIYLLDDWTARASYVGSTNTLHEAIALVPKERIGSREYIIVNIFARSWDGV